MRVTKDSKPLAPYHLRDHADADRGPFWEDEARQLLNWAADCMEAADRVIALHAPPSTQETRARPASCYCPAAPGEDCKLTDAECKRRSEMNR